MEALLELLEITNQNIKRLEAKIDRLTPVNQSEWIDKHHAAEIVCKTWRTLEAWRKNPDRGLLEGTHWQNDGGQVVYHRDRLTHWYSNRTHPAEHVAWLADQATQRSGKRRGRPPKNN